jgi:hypothetical protein
VHYFGLDWVGTILGLASVYVMGQNDRAAFVLRLLSSIFWASFGVVARSPAAVLANVASILLCVRGMVLGRRRTPQATPGRLSSARD